MEQPTPPEIEEAARRTAENIKNYKKTGEDSGPIDVAEVKRQMEEAEDISDELDELVVEEIPVAAEGEPSMSNSEMAEREAEAKKILEAEEAKKDGEAIWAAAAELDRQADEEKNAKALEEHDDYVKQLDKDIEASAEQGKKEEAEAARQMQRDQAEAAQQELAERKAATAAIQAEMTQAEKDKVSMQEIVDRHENRAESGSTVELAEQPQADEEPATAEAAPKDRDYTAEWNQQQADLEAQRMTDLEMAVDNTRNDLATKYGITDANSYAQQLLVSGWSRTKHAAKMLRPGFRKAWKRFTESDRELDALKKSEVLPDVKAMPKSRKAGDGSDGTGSVFSVKQK